MPDLRTSVRLRRRCAAVAGSLVLAVLAACGGQSKPLNPMVGADLTDDSMYGVVLDQPYTVAGPPLVSTQGSAPEGTPYSLTEDTDADLTLVFFGYSNCPDICQMVLANIANALARLDEADRERVQVLFVTTDPARDDVATLRTYLERFDPGFVGITGDLASLQTAAQSFHVYFEEGVRLASGGYDVTHNDQVNAVDADDTVPMLWMRDTSPHDLAVDLATLLSRPAS